MFSVDVDLFVPLDGEPRNRTAFFGNRTESILGVSRVVTTWSQPEIVCETSRTGKPLDGADAAGQRQTAVVAHNGGGHQNLCRAESFAGLDLTRSLDDLFIDFLQPSTTGLHLKGFGRIVPDQIVAIDDPVDLVQVSSAALSQCLSQ